MIEIFDHRYYTRFACADHPLQRCGRVTQMGEQEAGVNEIELAVRFQRRGITRSEFDRLQFLAGGVAASQLDLDQIHVDPQDPSRWGRRGGRAPA
jgi:hypothetical protein